MRRCRALPECPAGPSRYRGVMGRVGQAAWSSRSAASRPSAAVARTRGWGCGARAERMMASEARVSSSLTCRSARITRRGPDIMRPGRGRCVAVMAITSFMVRGGVNARGAGYVVIPTIQVKPRVVKPGCGCCGGLMERARVGRCPLRGDRTRRRLNGCLPPHQALHTVSEERDSREAGQHLPRGRLTSGDHETQSSQTGYSEQAAPRMGQ
jgi:hypothetical protein